jgi:hypothetical protein
MDTADLASSDNMAKVMASYEVFPVRGRHARSDMAEFIETLIQRLQELRIETKTYTQLGWTENYYGFVLGTSMVTLKGEEPVLCDTTVPPDLAVDFGTSGTLEDWVGNIDRLYNRPGAEPYQFALCHAMGSPLVQLMESSNWHGLPLALTGKGGTGKTTAAKIANGFYGDPSLLERQGGQDGSTIGAVIKRISVTGALPMLLDEFSGRSPEEIMRTGYALANGRDKERLASNGRFATTGDEWFKNSIITSNDGIHQTLSRMPPGYKIEATQLRFFEVQLPKGYLGKVFNDVDQNFVEHHMDKVYGTPCRPYLQFIMKNRTWVQRQLSAARAKMNPKSEEDNKERFYRDTIVTAWVAGKIAHKLGLISFDVGAMKKWAEDRVADMRAGRAETNLDMKEYVAQFISSLPGRLIVTKLLKPSGYREVPLEIMRGPAVGRVCIEDKKVYVVATAMRDWCATNGINQKELRDEMISSGLLVPQPGGGFTKGLYIGAGSTVLSSQTQCVELDYDKLFDGRMLAVVKNEDTTEVKSGGQT